MMTPVELWIFALGIVAVVVTLFIAEKKKTKKKSAADRKHSADKEAKCPSAEKDKP